MAAKRSPGVPQRGIRSPSAIGNQSLFKSKLAPPQSSANDCSASETCRSACSPNRTFRPSFSGYSSISQSRRRSSRISFTAEITDCFPMKSNGSRWACSETSGDSDFLSTDGIGMGMPSAVHELRSRQSCLSWVTSPKRLVDFSLERDAHGLQLASPLKQMLRSLAPEPIDSGLLVGPNANQRHHPLLPLKSRLV